MRPLQVLVVCPLLLLASSGCGGPPVRCGDDCRDASHPDAALEDADVHETDAADASRIDASDATIDGPDASDAGTSPELLPDPVTIAGPLTVIAYGNAPFLTSPPIAELLTNGFSIGREFFVADWVAAPNATRPTIDGLGPLFHATSCVACHPGAGRAPSLGASGAVAFGLLFRLGPSDAVFGGQLQPFAISGATVEGSVNYAEDPVRPMGVSPASPRPIFSATTSTVHGAIDPATRLGARLSPQLLGMGLLENVPERVILAWADPLDEDGDGISGRGAMVTTPSGTALGRFGWKAIKPTLRAQSSAAFAGDMGITSPDHDVDDCTPPEVDCVGLPSGGAPEIDGAGLDAVDIFMSFLAVPAARRDNADPQMILGSALFASIGCADCHRATLHTDANATIALLANTTFHPYTDLLLHDMGVGLEDAIAEGDATAREWRTPPLWGVGLVEGAPNARFLHDGRATTLADAIAWHGGEALVSRDAFLALTTTEANALLAFLRSL